ncbi:MAG: cytosine permease, partial [Brachybacterium tyrofermentans]
MTSPDSTASPDGPASSDGSGSSGDPGSPASPAPVGGAGVIETTGIEIIAESERTAKPRDLVWPWFAANVSVFGMSYGSYLLGFSISFVQATIVAVIGIVISFALCGLVAIAGKRGSAPTMVLSRAAFGVHGQKVPGI